MTRRPAATSASRDDHESSDCDAGQEETGGPDGYVFSCLFVLPTLLFFSLFFFPVISFAAEYNNDLAGIVLSLRLLFARPSECPRGVYDHNVPGTKAGTCPEGLDRLNGWLNVLLSSYCYPLCGIVIASRDRLSFESRKRSEKLINKIKEIVELK